MIFCLEESGRSIKYWSCIEAKSQKLVSCQTEWGGKVENAVLNEHRGEREVRSVVHLLNEKGDEFALHPTLFSWKSWLSFCAPAFEWEEGFIPFALKPCFREIRDLYRTDTIGASCFLGCASLCGNLEIKQSVAEHESGNEEWLIDTHSHSLFTGKMGFICSHSRRSFLQPTYRYKVEMAILCGNSNALVGTTHSIDKLHYSFVHNSLLHIVS